MVWVIVVKSNFDRDLYVEKFVTGLCIMSEDKAKAVAESLNDLLSGDSSEDYYVAERSDYKLYNGYEELM